VKPTERQKRPVTVFGAGIAGMTAAHELVMRGFHVQVIDPDYNAEWEKVQPVYDRGIGGMARSQWAIALNGYVSGETFRRLWSGAELLQDVVLEFAAGRPTDPDRAHHVMERLIATLRELRAELPPQPFQAIAIRIHGVELVPPDNNDFSDPFYMDPRVVYIRDVLVGAGFTSNEVNPMFSAWPKSGDTTIVSFAPGGKVVAAEHGFRFFPSFYRHLFDTMQRTPIIFPRESERTKATAFENLTPAKGLGFARDGKAISFMIPRRAPESFEEIRRTLNEVLEELGYTLSDISRFSLKLFKYMTSCAKRRRTQYENMSWGAFLESHRYSPISQKHIEYGPQMSAALRGSQSDARTQGNITIQLLMDQLKKDALADYTLSGPTSGAWLDHWHDFLRREGVTFHRGTLVDFRNDGGVVKPVVKGVDDKELEGEFFVLALSLPAMAPLAEKFLAVAPPGASQLGDLHKVIEFAGNLSTLDQREPSGPLQHLSGIQFYFDQDVRFWRGHTQYLDSAWGLTSIAQPQFWARQRTPDDDYLSLLSVDIGIFDRPYRPKAGGLAKSAWECTADEIARYTWEQIHAHMDDAFKKKYGPGAIFPTPTAYSLDHALELTSRNGTIKRNHSTFLVNKTGEYRRRPGAVMTKRGESKCISRYDIIADHYVLAGTFMQTFTRLTSMEGANESARHAVNALLQYWNIGGDRCDIWDPEDNEVSDMQWFKDLDRVLCKKGLPHIADILGWDEIPDHIPNLRSLHLFRDDYSAESINDDEI
jgi:hypothetical protein